MTKNKHLIVVMGVTGCGKSTLAQQLAQHFSAPMIEADDYHTDHAKFIMSKGMGLSEGERIPWLQKLNQVSQETLDHHSAAVLSCSVLKKDYRDRFRDQSYQCHFIWLNTTKSLIIERLQHREGHFASASLLDSQFATLEIPRDEADCVEVDGAKSTQEQMNASLAVLNVLMDN